MGRVLLLSAGVVLTLGFHPCDSKTLRVPDDHATLTEAIAAASPGDTVAVGPGQYPENLLIRAPLHLVSIPRRQAEIVGQEARQSVVSIEGVEGGVLVRGFRINGNVGSTAGVGGLESSVRVEDNEIYMSTNGVELRQCDGEIADNLFRNNFGTAIHLRGSSPRIVRNRFDDRASAAILVVGKNSRPVVGGAPGEGNVFGNGYGSEITNETKNEIDARYNQWSWSATLQMDSQPYPSNINAIYDEFDSQRFGKVDYRHWVSGEGGGEPRLRVGLTVAVAIVAVAIVSMLVVLGRRRRAA